MATKPDTSSEFNPRHRIVGAIILVSLAVIFVPMILQDSPPASKVASEVTQIPATPQTKTIVTPVADLGKVANGGAAAEPVAPAPAVAPESRPAERPAPRPAPARPPAESAPAKAAEWIIQVGTFSDRANADRLGREIKAHGFGVTLEPVKLAQSRAVRVRVGPYRDREAAVQAQERLRKELGVRGIVLTGH